ncbi:MAG TPA: LCP family protein [Candidatus Saccharimonadales bacterium]|nr:LCP family protein [Candidatus Saccharimonadales bacterium]
MNTHRNRGRKSSTSIDGIVQTGRTIGVPPRVAHRPGIGRPQPSLDNFNRRTDGFYPSRSASAPRQLDSSEAEEASLLDEPIVLDDIQTRHRKLRFWQQHTRLKTVLKRIALFFGLLVLAGVGYFGYKLYNTQKQVLAGGGKAAAICTDDVAVSQLHKEGDSRINILMLGIGGPGHDGPDLTDTIMLASIDPINDKAVLLSLPRDLWVNIPGYGSEKINHAYAYGKEYSKSKTTIGKEQAGVTLLDKTLQPVLDGVPIHYHVLLDFQAFKQMVNALGGVTVNVPETLYDPTIAWENHWNPVIATKGLQKFNGQQALLYARSRETSSDFARGERQRLIISAVKQKVFSVGTFSNPIRVSSLLDSLGRNVYTDFSLGDLKCLYRQLSTIPSSRISSLDMVAPPNNLLTTGSLAGQSIVEPIAGLDNYSSIHDFLHKYLKDGLITKENAPVAIYNATSTSGLATSQSNVLKQYGYNVVKVDNAPKTLNPPTTTLVDLSHGNDDYTLHYLESRLGVTATGKLPSQYGISPPQNAKFVIILGEDATSYTSR